MILFHCLNSGTKDDTERTRRSCRIKKRIAKYFQIYSGRLYKSKR